MLDYNILNQKPTVITVEDGKYVEHIDLLARTYNGNIGTGGRLVQVEEYYIARPDLISLAVYGDDKYADFICKVNGISNPFELNKDMILYIPDISVINGMITNRQTKSDILDEFKELKNDIISQYTASNISKQSETKETIEKDKGTLQKYKNERRSPGEQTVTDNNYIIDRSLGLVIY